MDQRPARKLRYRQTTERSLPKISRVNKYSEPRAEAVSDGALYRENVKVSFTIMAHPKRADWAEDLARSIGCGITWDTINDRHDTGLRSIMAYDPGADYHVVIQDDAIVGVDFVEGLKGALRYVPPGHPVGLYYGAKDGKNSHHVRGMQAAVDQGASWLVRKGPVWGPAIAYPVDNILTLAEWFKNSDVPNYDRRVMFYYQSLGMDCWYSVPSMVDHRTKGNPSLTNHDDGRPPRAAKVFSGPQSLLEVGWDGPVLLFKR